MKKLIILSAAVLASYTGFSQNWNLDKTHAKLGFSITHMMVSDVDGAFKNFDAKVTSSKPDFTDAQIELTADINSIDTDNEKRDEHLKAPDFFDAAKYNTLTFKSKSLKKVSGKNYKMTGDLTMHGVTKTVTLDVVFNGTTTHPYNKKTVAGFKVKGVVKRNDFKIGTETSTAMLSDEVELNANIELVQG